ncbi:hypothetical protein P872_16845 [Rhodonellum psychrophilum GCM71 = DSM 17998]|uniref:Uncharacterized protein n=1 Tax=Rhodonellum psychrophilum GCM71 = DSM 17998 TaxID=1123057 RepID=U5BRH9_9BACT|nr:hypothetical protein P872_16845 [Rhodonellum psychrophilum GCM71 = DSM 17998]
MKRKYLLIFIGLVLFFYLAYLVRNWEAFVEGFKAGWN